MNKHFFRILGLSLMILAGVGLLVFGKLPERTEAAHDAQAQIIPALQNSTASQQALNIPKAEYVLQLSGSEAYVAVPHDPALNPNSASAFTLEAWVKRDNSDRCETILRKGDAYWLGFCNTTIRFYTAGTGNAANGATAVPANVWTHVAVVYEGSGRKYYINGELDYIGSPEIAPITNTLSVYIGGDPTSPDDFDGRISNVRLWNVARTQDAIRRTMHVALEESLPGLVANWRFSEDYGDNIGGFDGVPTGASLVFETAPAQPTYADIIDQNFNTLPQGRYAAASATIPWRDRIILIGGISGSTIEDEIYSIQGSSGETALLHTLPQAIAYGDAVYVPSNDQIYLFGGSHTIFADESARDTIYTIDPLSGTVTLLPTTLPTATTMLDVAYHPGHDNIYLFGGLNATGPMSTVLIFDPTAESLTPAGFALDEALYEVAAVHSQATDKLYVFGGHNSTSHVDTIYEITLDADGINGTVQQLSATLPEATDSLGVFADPYTHLIYLMGGAYQKWIWIFDPVTSEIWSTRIALPDDLEDPLVSFSHPNRHALIIGGASGDTNIWRVPLGDGPLVPLGYWDFPAPAESTITAIDGETDGVIVTTEDNGAWLYKGDGTRQHYTAAQLGSASGQVNDGRYYAYNGSLYLATEDAGAKEDDGSTLTTYGNAEFGTNIIRSAEIPGTYGTAGQGVWWRAYQFVFPDGLQAYWVQNFAGDYVQDLAMFESGTLWMLANDNLKRLTYSTLLGTSSETDYGWPCGELLDPLDLDFGTNGDLWVVSSGTVEFGGEGICRIPAGQDPSSGATISVDPALGNLATAVDADGDGRVWIGLQNDIYGDISGGLAVFEASGGSTAVVRTTEYNWLNAPIGSLSARPSSSPTYWDSGFVAVGATEERAWVGKADARLITLSSRWQQVNQSNDIGDKIIQNLWTVRGRTFLATSDSLHVLMPDGHTWDNHSSVKVWDVMGDHQGRIWVATNTGIRLYTSGGWDYLYDKPGDRPSTATYALAEDLTGRIWIGGLHGLTLFDRERFVATFTDTNTDLPDTAIRTLFVDSDNRLWAGTDNGLARLTGATWETFTTSVGLPNNAIFDVEQLGSADIAISTANGLSFYDGSSFTTQAMPIDDSNLPLSVDENGRLWAGNAVQIDGAWQRYYTTNSGLASDQISDSATDGADRIWFSHAPDTGVSVRGTYLPPLANVVPLISSVSPITGAVGDELIISGSGFGTSRYDVRVNVGQAQADVLSVDSGEIRVRLTEQNTSGDVSVAVAGRRTTLSDAFCAIPSIDRFTPTGGNDGVTIHIYGSNLDPNADVFLGSDTPRAAYTGDATHLSLDIRDTAGIGPVRVENHCGYMATSAEEFNRISLSVEQIVLNQGIPSTGLVADRRTMIQHYLSHSVAPRSTDSLEIDYVEITFMENGTLHTYGIRYTGAFPTTPGAPADALLRDIVNSVNINVTPNLDGNLIPGDNVQVQSVLKRAGRVVAQGNTTAWFRPNQPVRVLLVPIMRNDYNASHLRNLKQTANANLGDLRGRIWPTGRVEFYWSPAVYTADDVLWLGGDTVDIGDTLMLYDASHNLDSARRWWNETHDPDVMIAYGVVEPEINTGGAAGKAFWPNLSQMLNLAGLEALDTLCDIGATAVNVLTFGLADASCDLEIPLYVGWGERSSNASELIGHEMGHIFGLVQPVAPNGDLFDNFSHSVYDEIDGGECSSLPNDGAFFNAAKTLYRAAGVNVPVVNPLTGAQFRPQLTATDTWTFGDPAQTVTSEALFPRGKAIMSYACDRNNNNVFFEPADVLGIYYEYTAAPARNFFDDLLPGRASAAGAQQPAARTANPTPKFVPGTRLYVSGLVSKTTSTGEFRRVEVLGENAPLDLSYQTGYWLVQLNGNGQEITRTGVFPVFRTMDAGGAAHTEEPENDTGFFAATILAQDTLANLELRREDTVLDTLSAGSSTPTITLSSPTGGAYASGTITVTWSANDADGDDLSIAILYSDDGGVNWLPVGFSDEANGSHALPIANLAGSTDAAAFTSRVKVIASDGFHIGENTSNAFTIAAQPPLAFISTPLEGDSFLEGQPVYLYGGAVDNQDGELSGSALRWFSDQDGDLGTGESSETFLNIGTHLLTLEATNSEGLSDSAMVTVTIIGDYDYDGIPDEDELSTSRNVLMPADAFEDADGDGLPYVMEIAQGLNPVAADSDGDGRNDDDEIADGTDPSTSDSPLPADTLTAFPAALTFESDRALGTAMPQAQVILSSYNAVSWTLTADVDWLAAVKVEGVTPDSTLILVNTENLEADGVHTGNLFFASSLGTATVPVTATITSLPTDTRWVYLPLILRAQN